MVPAVVFFINLALAENSEAIRDALVEYAHGKEAWLLG
jgi:hypothetical protein